MLPLLLALALLSPAAPAGMVDDFPLIRAVVFDYLSGINEVNGERLQRAFHPAAELKSVGDSGELVIEPVAAAIERWMRGTPGARRGEILSIDMSGGHIARVVFDFDGVYVDFLTLAKLNGQWKIIDKVFVKK